MDVQTTVLLSTAVVFLLTLILAVYISTYYTKRRTLNYLFWAAGLWLFAFGVLLEMAFALGAYSGLLIGTYLFVVALLVEMLAVGSLQLIKSRSAKVIFYAYSIAVTALLAYYLLTTQIGNLLVNYVVAGNPPMNVILASSLATFPAVAIILVIAALGYKRTKNKKLLSIIIGVIVVSIAGTLYIAAFPAFLYYSEFIGVLLLWFGFLDFGSLAKGNANRN